MKGRFFDAVLSILAGVLLFGVGYAVGQSRWAPLNLIGSAGETPESARADFAPFWQVWHLLNQEYIDRPLETPALIDGAIQGMLATLDDPHTVYLTPREQQAAQDSISGQLEGIGAEIESVEGAITIVSPFDGSPAAEAGLQPRDIILQVDGVDVNGMDLSEAAGLIRGPAGTAVDLVIDRAEETLSLTIVRGLIKIPSVTLIRLEAPNDDLAYLRLSRFSDLTNEELKQALESDLVAGAAGLVLDLRRNPGGMLTAVVEVADQFLEDGVILTEDFGGGREESYEAGSRGLAQEIPLVVLVDEGSASASEVLAGALRDQGRALIVGQQTFGKGTVQSWTTLQNGGGLRMTIARWLTPNGTWVTEAGLRPDVEVAPAAAGVEDMQLEQAVEIFRGEIARHSPLSARD